MIFSFLPSSYSSSNVFVFSLTANFCWCFLESIGSSLSRKMGAWPKPATTAIVPNISFNSERCWRKMKYWVRNEKNLGMGKIFQTRGEREALIFCFVQLPLSLSLLHVLLVLRLLLFLFFLFFIFEVTASAVCYLTNINEVRHCAKPCRGINLEKDLCRNPGGDLRKKEEWRRRRRRSQEQVGERVGWKEEVGEEERGKKKKNRRKKRKRRRRFAFLSLYLVKSIDCFQYVWCFRSGVRLRPRLLQKLKGTNGCEELRIDQTHLTSNLSSKNK